MFLCLGFFLCFEGQGGPKHKEFTGVRAPLEGGGGLRGGFPAKLFMFMRYAFLRGLKLSCKICLAAVFASRHQDASPGPLGSHQQQIALTLTLRHFSGVVFGCNVP